MNFEDLLRTLCTPGRPGFITLLHVSPGLMAASGHDSYTEARTEFQSYQHNAPTGTRANLLHVDSDGAITACEFYAALSKADAEKELSALRTTHDNAQRN
jgi:hypothetical protein